MALIAHEIVHGEAAIGALCAVAVTAAGPAVDGAEERRDIIGAQRVAARAEHHGQLVTDRQIIQRHRIGARAGGIVDGKLPLIAKPFESRIKSTIEREAEAMFQT